MLEAANNRGKAEGKFARRTQNPPESAKKMGNRILRIKVKPTMHKNSKRLQLIFEKDNYLISLIRRISDCRWSQTMQCWHIPYYGDIYAHYNKRI